MQNFCQLRGRLSIRRTTPLSRPSKPRFNFHLLPSDSQTHSTQEAYNVHIYLQCWQLLKVCFTPSVWGHHEPQFPSVTNQNGFLANGTDPVNFRLNRLHLRGRLSPEFPPRSCFALLPDLRHAHTYKQKSCWSIHRLFTFFLFCFAKIFVLYRVLPTTLFNRKDKLFKTFSIPRMGVCVIAIRINCN